MLPWPPCFLRHCTVLIFHSSFLAGTGAVFQGILNTEIPVGTNVKYSGYCAIRSNPKKVSALHSSTIIISGANIEKMV